MRKQPDTEERPYRPGVRGVKRAIRGFLLGAVILIIVIYGLLILFPDLK